MISIKDYAKENGVTYEAVRQQVKRYHQELAGHIHIQGRTQYLDDVAVAILNSHRSVNPVVVYDKGAGEDFRALQQELANARAETKDYWEQLKKKDETMAVLVQQNEQYRLQAASVAQLEADNQAAKDKIAEAEKNVQKAAEELQRAEKEKDAWKQYAIDLEAYNALGRFKRWRQKIERPVAPATEEEVGDYD